MVIHYRFLNGSLSANSSENSLIVFSWYCRILVELRMESKEVVTELITGLMGLIVSLGRLATELIRLAVELMGLPGCMGLPELLAVLISALTAYKG